MRVVPSVVIFCWMMCRTIGNNGSPMEKDRIGSLLMHHCDFAKKLSSDERKQIVARLRDNLDVDIEVGNPWDSVEAPDGVYRTDGWAVIPEYIGESSCLVFSPGAREIWNFSSGGALLDF